jgi:hypothetical protein
LPANGSGAGVPKGLKTLAGKVEAKPDQTATLDAQTFYPAQVRFRRCREAIALKAAEIAWTSAA